MVAACGGTAGGRKTSGPVGLTWGWQRCCPMSSVAASSECLADKAWDADVLAVPATDTMPQGRCVG